MFLYLDKSIKQFFARFFFCIARMDKLHMALTDLCYAINYYTVIQVWDHGFVPREFFIQHLETRFNKYVLGDLLS